MQKVETSADVKKKQDGSKRVSETTVKKSTAKPAKQIKTKEQKQADGPSAKQVVIKEQKQTEDPPTSSDAEDEPNPDDDHTAELLDGFSSFSESEAEETKTDKHSKPKPVPAAPSTATALAHEKKNNPQSHHPNEDRGTLYIGRIPHGFYEHQLRSYFSQFGSITNLRLSRNRRTGASKHYGFLEFESAEVARIVAETMDNYLLFGHILQVKIIEQGKVPEGMWRGANRRFKKVPWNGIERGRLRSADREAWGRRVSREEGRRRKKLEKMRGLGYVFEVPAVRQVDSVPVREGANAEGPEEAAPKQIEKVKDSESDLKQLLKESDNASEVKEMKVTVDAGGVKETTKVTTVA